jgi:NAD(P)-dependent dehydrogenase (short-subunit alcohol dehydrogenase family)
MTGSLDGRLALISGAGSGIGEAIAHAMAKAGARIIVADIDERAAQSAALAIGGQAASFACDVTDRAGCDGLDTAAALAPQCF